jgi:RND superfamily putative drug exporter
MRADGDVARVDSLLTGPPQAFVSRDGRATFVAATLRSGAGEQDAADRLRDRIEGQPGVTLGGAAIAQQAVGKQVQEDLARAELLAFPALFILSLLIFRGLVASILPLVVGGIAIVTTFLAIRVVNAGAVGMSVFAINLVTGLGLGLAIDYSLFMLSRYREELARSGPGVDALRATMTTAGRTVLFSALTVAAALASLLVFPQRFLYSMGIGGVIVAIVAAAAALLVLPAILATLGRRVDALAPARLQRAPQAESAGFWYRLSRGVMRRPGRVALSTATLLIVLGLPFTGIRFTGIDPTVLPHGAPARTVDEALRTEFPPNETSPITLAMTAPRAAAPQVERYAASLRALPGVARVDAPRPVAPGLWRVDVAARGATLSRSAKDLVRDVRARPAPFPVEVGGGTAEFVDRQASLAAHLPVALAVVAATTFTILFLMTGSVVLPVKALLMNLLSLSAAFGLLVLIFQDGRLESLLAYTSQGALESTQPVLLFAVAFGLSTDYGVFLLGRIKEAHDGGLETREAVAVGLERTGRLVSAAALLFCVAIGAFATSQIVFIKELGVGTALAVLIDATIVRALLVPSLMALLGRWNWWAPRPLRRLHARIGLSEASQAATA